MKTLKITGNAIVIILLLSILALANRATAQTTQTYPATGTWICPAGVSTVQVEAWGGGGAGGGNTSNSDGGGGGGGGAYSKTTNVSVIQGTTYTVTVGTGGNGGSGNGAAGNDSWFKTSATILAKGGAGGAAVSGGNAGNGGNAGSSSSSIGTTKFSGGNGGAGRNNNSGQGGPGGSSAGTAANGTSGAGTWSTVTAGNAPTGGGKGGNGGISGSDGSGGSTPGAGGGGAGDNNSNGGSGADGQLKLTWTCPTYSLTSAAIATGPFCGNSSSVVTLKSSSLASANYIVTYNLTGATTAAGSTATMTFTAGSPGTGTFSTSILSVGTSTITITNLASEGCNNTISTNNTASVVVTAAPTALAGTAISTCATSGAVNITAGSSATNNSGITWTSNGSGAFTNSNSLTTCTYLPSAADKSAGSVTLTLTATGNGSCGPATSTKTLTINAVPTAIAGTAVLSCSNAGAVNITAGSSASNQASITWTSNGTGIFSNATSLTNATYTPSAADITAGSRTLTITANPLSGCSAVISTKTITITAAPTAVAGTAISTCATSGAINITAGSTASNNSGITWNSSGTGSFTNPTSITTCTYLPSASDISAGSVTLTLDVDGNNTCADALSTKTLTIIAAPTAVAGTAISTCATSGAVNITAGSSASNNSGITWTSSGSGTFTSSTSLTLCTYNPSTADKTAGSVTLTLTANGNGSCADAVSTKTLTISPAPTATAGTAISTCSTIGAVNITAGSSATNQASVTWTCNGTGTFTNASSLTLCTYTPSAADITAGSRTLTLTANPLTGCSAVTSTKTITITTAPTAVAGTAISTCATSGAVNVTAGSSASNNSGITWTSSGSGTFTNSTSLTLCTYNPSAADKTAGSVTLTLTANGNGSCADAVSTKTLTINAAPTANAGTAISTCSNSGAVNITAGSSATNQASITWTCNGTGTFTNASSLTLCTYTPSATDITAGSRTLTLTSNPLGGCSAVTSTKTITITNAPTAVAGTAISTCATSGAVNVTAGSSASNNSGITWTSSGNGTFTNATSLTLCTYNPSAADKTAGSVTLTLTANGNGSCADAVSTKTLTINAAPTANAGTAISTCSNSGAVNITAGSSATNQASITWTCNGTGTFTNASSLTLCTYTPSAADITAGSRTLTLTANPLGGCSAVTSTKTITITTAPTSVAGTAISTCATSGAINITAGSSASHQTSVSWTSNGTGTFANATSLTLCAYTPSVADISAGSRTITLTAFGNGSCASVTSTKTITINPIPTANAGNAVTTCASAGAVNITSGASASNQSSVVWSSNGTGSFTNSSSLTNASYTPSAADIAAGSVTLTLTANGLGGCSSTISTKTLTINPASVGGNVSADASVCTGSNSGILTLSGHIGAITKWQSSINGGTTWTDIVNTTITRNYSNLTSTTLFRAVVQNGSCAVANSNPATITVIPTTAISTQPSSTTTCSGNNVTFSVAANGGSLNYQWQDNSLGGFTNISGATASSLALNSITNGMSGRQFKCIITGACGNATSSTVTLTVNPGSVGGIVNSSTSVCPGSNSGTLTLSGHTGNVTKWQSSTNGGTSWTDIVSTATTRTYTNLNTTTMYRAVVQNGTCTAANSVAATITVLPASVGGSVTSSTSVCSGINSGTLNLTGNTGTVVKWQFSTNNGSTYTDIANTTSSLSYSNISATTLYRAVVQSGSCATANSSAATLTVNSPSVGGTVNSNASVCSGTNSGTLTLSGHTGTVQKWQSSIDGGSTWSDIASTSTNRSYSNLTTTTLYRAVVQNGACTSANSAAATITVNPLPTLFTVNGGGPYCNGGAGVPVGLSGSQLGVNYQLKIGASNSGSPVAGTGSALSFGNKTAIGTYTVSATIASTSCSVTMNGSVSVSTSVAPGTPSVSPTISTVFPGNVQALTAQIASSNATFGTGTSTNTSTTFPAPLGTYYGGARHQILILASELSAQGIVAGEQITSLSFNVSNTNNAHAMINYTISMGTTALSTLSASFVNGLTQVYYSPSYAAVNGVNNFNFSSPYIWNGTSNIIVETVFNNNYLGTSSNPNCSVRYTTTSTFTSVNYSRADNAGVGNSPILALSSNGTSNRRPNMVLGHGLNASMIWSPTTGLFTDATASIPYNGTGASTVFAQPSASTTYSVVATLAGGCTSPASATAVVNVITTPPNCVTASVGNSSCVTSTFLTWSAAANFPSGYYVYIGTDNPPTNLVYQQDVGIATSLNLPILNASTTYYYQIAPYNVNGENTSCYIGSFVSGSSASASPSQAISYALGFENSVLPSLPCGITKSDENFPVDGFGWYSSNIAPHSGSKHLRIDKNTNNTTAKDDWFYSAPLNLTAGKLYRIFWYARASSNTKIENYEIYLSNSPDAATMQSTAAVFMGNTNLLTYKLDSSSDIIAPYTGTFYFGFHANSAANAASLYVDDILMKEIPVTALNPISCTTVSSLADQIFCNNIYGAQDYRYRVENLSTSFSYEYDRHLPIPDFRLIWAPGVLYGMTYDVSVSYKKNNSWSPYGASCPVTIGPFPIVQLKAPYCNVSITNQSTQIFTDSVAGANDYEYKIVNSSLGYDHTWTRGNSSNDYRLAWAYQFSPVLVQTLPFGYTYDVQVRALVGKTDAAHGNLPGEYGTFGSVCQLTLAGSPQTQLAPTSCGISLTNLTDPIYCIPVPGATDYQYHIVNTTDGYDQYVIRNSVSTDFRLSWIGTSTVLGVKYGTIYDVSVRAKVGGVWLNFGPLCQVTTPVQPLTNLQAAYCNFTLPTFQTSVYCVPVPGATSYRYHISGPNGYDKVMDRNNASTDFKFSWTLLCCGQQNMLPNTSYQVEVASLVGGAWSAYGAACTVTTGASVPRFADIKNEGTQKDSQTALSLSVYPNPAAANQEYSIALSGLNSLNEKLSLSITDVLGKKVYSADILTNEENTMLIKPEIKLPSGIYTVEIIKDIESYKEKLIVN